MPKIVGTRERVHQPFYDSLIRVDGSVDLRSTNQGVFGAVPNRAQLFVRQGADISVRHCATVLQNSKFKSNLIFLGAVQPGPSPF